MRSTPIEQFLRRLADDTKEHAILFLDPDGTILWWNAATEQIFGASPEILAGKPLSFLFTEEDRSRGLPELELEIARAHGAAENDRWLARTDGYRFWAAGATTCLLDDAGRVIGFGKILSNRTDIKEILDGLRNALDDLSRRDEHRTTFLSTLSHELRNPLTPLKNAAALLRLLPPDSRERPACLDMIDRQIAMLSRLVDDLLDVARIGAGKIDLELRPTTLQSVLRQAVDAMVPKNREHGHRLEFLVLPDPIAIAADEQRLVQVFTNLVANAIKYTPDGGNIWVKGSVEGDEAVARIEDDGIGISPEMLPKIFDLFTQADVTLTRSEGGLGIGLSVVRDLVRLHGGTVQVTSNGLGKGTEFTVRLPLQKPPE